MLLVHRGVRPLPPERRAEGLRRRPPLLLRRAGVLPQRQARAQAVRPRGHGGDQVPHHAVPAHLLRHRELRGRAAQAHVSISYILE